MDINDKDYGFPFVEPVKLDSREAPVKTFKEIASEPQMSKPEVAQATPVVQATTISDRPVEKSKKSKAITVFLLVSILLILSAMAYFLYYADEINPQKLVVDQESAKEEESIAAQEDVEVLEEELAVDDPITEEVVISTEEVAEAPKVVAAPTTRIENETRGSMVTVSGRGDRATYYIIVASVPNEALAMEESEKYLSKGVNLWKILPYDDNKNYRLAAGKFASFRDASNALEPAKAQFSESVWILKY
ncbi:SPOR domain-containing protein [Mongoliitalea daihaiensis]|uniref:SPOR domain-containing protein n=1 Tax=Mongoliitalea daihaiensis TaxID=2782006 RepID=UPI001F1FB231|nr:SPOR domain-containing protein [Mongoliitalea daihaiensis]UJP64283.1 SPOR domain-containing protein [Mongoliitalea daihaiensis]